MEFPIKEIDVRFNRNIMGCKVTTDDNGIITGNSDLIGT